MSRPVHPSLPLLKAGKPEEALRLLQHRGDCPPAEAMLRHRCELYAGWFLEDWTPPQPVPEGITILEAPEAGHAD